MRNSLYGVRLWSDLAKLARKQEVWDVARVASTFCLLYDDGRWNIIRANDSSLETTLPKVQNLVATNEEITAHNNTELMRILAEVYCIHGEAYLCKSRDEGTLLGDSPSPPQDPKLKQKNQVTNTLDDPDWKTYCDWVKSLWQTAINDFKRALQLGCELSESWLVYSAAAYLWNYCKHKFDQASFREFVPVFQPVLTAMKTIGINGESVLYSEISYVLAKGIIQPWLPELPTRIVLPLEVEKGKGGGGGGGNTTAGIAHSNTAISNRTVQSSMTGSDNSIVTAGMKVPRIINIDPDATPELKQAMDIIENALTLTNGSNDNNKIPLSLRHKMLTLWVYLRQLLNINIPRNLSHEHDENKTPVLSASKAITAVEMISSSRNGLGEFVNCPTLNDAIKWVESANISWNDCIVELYLWSKLALVSLQVKNFNNVISCSEKGLKFGTRTEITSLKSQKIQEW
ncbi:uncharacterized protein TRIADDRAFT_60791 [Trichoplax adhaerens]|uniref:Uncharacterized protein n=1 Tax=Trichoplax adhaerens TaxID=10228 RepID=B3S8Y8_TRIAD|nr:hypothetical protein TRIADDRAFT_60791 [Trichoplax adhaerens]EDV20853.1 hypothetical protein TRIADDRAFT_60791 [Trichoplax adhaerens]|eukprot:XP_002116794.1 hypothetical protein TRIADDRAFT_60791 [Trichoplax adhaerens]